MIPVPSESANDGKSQAFKKLKNNSGLKLTDEDPAKLTRGENCSKDDDVINTSKENDVKKN